MLRVSEPESPKNKSNVLSKELEIRLHISGQLDWQQLGSVNLGTATLEHLKPLQIFFPKN